jgi:hypothetical protein
MADSLRSPVVGMTPPSLATAGAGDWQSVVHPCDSRPTPDVLRREFRRVTIGFWLGGVVLGAGGCILGACMPYHHPVAVTLSVLWWSTYLGCLGASIGAWLGLLSDRTPARPSQGTTAAGKLAPRAGDRPSLADGAM